MFSDSCGRNQHRGSGGISYGQSCNETLKTCCPSPTPRRYLHAHPALDAAVLVLQPTPPNQPLASTEGISVHLPVNVNQRELRSEDALRLNHRDYALRAAVRTDEVAVTDVADVRQDGCAHIFRLIHDRLSGGSR